MPDDLVDARARELLATDAAALRRWSLEVAVERHGPAWAALVAGGEAS